MRKLQPKKAIHLEKPDRAPPWVVQASEVSTKLFIREPLNAVLTFWNLKTLQLSWM